MKTIVIKGIALLSVLSLSACRIVTKKSLGPVETHPVSVSDFNAIDFSYPARVTYVPADTFSVSVKAAPETFERMDISVIDSVLTIEKKMEKKIQLFRDDKLNDAEVVIKAPALSRVTIGGVGSFTSGQTLNADKLELIISGVGLVDISDIKAHDVTATIMGAAKMNLGMSGVKQANVSSVGSGQMNLDFRQCGNVTATISGAGDITLRGEVKSLKQDISGAGRIDTSHLTVKP